MDKIKIRIEVEGRTGLHRDKFIERYYSALKREGFNVKTSRKQGCLYTLEAKENG